MNSIRRIFVVSCIVKPLIHIAYEYALISATYVVSVRFPFADRTYGLLFVFGTGKFILINAIPNSCLHAEVLRMSI
jgi:hypothetical protein